MFNRGGTGIVYITGWLSGLTSPVQNLVTRECRSILHSWWWERVWNMKPINQQIAEYMEYCEYVRHFSDQTVENKTYIFRLFIRETGVVDMASFTNKDLNEWVVYQRMGIDRPKPVSSRTINTRVKHVLAFARYLKDMDHKVSLKPQLVQMLKEDPPRRTFFTREQVMTALATGTLMDQVMWGIKFDSGLRISELMKLRVGDFDGRSIKVVGKGRKAGVVFIRTETELLLKEYIERHKVTDWLWPSSREGYKDQHMSLDAIRVRGRKLFERAGLRGFYPHSLRHSFATDLRNNGAPLDVTQKLMRHSSISTTQVYLHNLDTGMSDEYEKYMNSHLLTTV